MARWNAPLVSLALAALFAATSAACSSAPSPPADEAGGGGGGSDMGACPPGQIPGDQGSCAPAGIQGCAAEFIESDGICRPSMDKCPNGTIPKFSEGCVATGIPDCAPAFVGDDGFCHPTMAACGAGTFALPRSGCVSVDGPDGCGTGTWGNITDAAGTIYVDPSYTGATGVGSKTKPLTTIAAALVAIAPGGHVALAAGHYTEPIAPTQAVVIDGRCASMVTIDGVDDDPTAPAAVRATHDLTLRGVSLAGAGIGLVANGTVAVTLERSVIDGTSGDGVAATSGAQVTIDHVLVQGAGGKGLAASGGASVTATDTTLYQNTGAGFAATGAKTLASLTNTLVEGTNLLSNGNSGYGGYVYNGPSVSLDGVAILDCHKNGLSVNFASVAAQNLVVDGTLLDGGDAGGDGVTVGSDSTLSLTGAAILRSAAGGVTALYQGARVVVSQSLISESQAGGNNWPAPFGFSMIEGANGKITDSAIVKSRFAAMIVSDLGSGSVTTIDARGVLVEDTLEDTLFHHDGEAVVVSGDVVELTLANSMISRATVAGVLVAQSDVPKTVRIETSLVAGTRAGTSVLANDSMTVSGIGDGIVVSKRSSVIVQATRIESCIRAGMLFDNSTGIIQRSTSTKNVFGVVFDGSLLPATDGLSAFEHNTQQDVENSGNLPVPSVPAKTPM